MSVKIQFSTCCVSTFSISWHQESQEQSQNGYLAKINEKTATRRMRSCLATGENKGLICVLESNQLQHLLNAFLQQQPEQCSTGVDIAPLDECCGFWGEVKEWRCFVLFYFKTAPKHSCSMVFQAIPNHSCPMTLNGLTRTLTVPKHICSNNSNPAAVVPHLLLSSLL